MKRSLSSIGLHSFQGIWALPQMRQCVNHVSGTFCKLCVDQHTEIIAQPLLVLVHSVCKQNGADHESLEIARWPGYEGGRVVRVPDAVVVDVVFVPDAVAVSVDSGRCQESILDCSQKQT